MIILYLLMLGLLKHKWSELVSDRKKSDEWLFLNRDKTLHLGFSSLTQNKSVQNSEENKFNRIFVEKVFVCIKNLKALKKILHYTTHRVKAKNAGSSIRAMFSGVTVRPCSLWSRLTGRTSSSSTATMNRWGIPPLTQPPTV